LSGFSDREMENHSEEIKNHSEGTARIPSDVVGKVTTKNADVV
jgi:hypothetical protein